MNDLGGKVQASSGRYVSPIEVSIAGIKTMIVDPHNEVFPSWYTFGRQRAAVVVHVDAHSDTSARSPPLLEELVRKTKGIIEYSAEFISIATFIAPGIHHKILGPVYHIDPRERAVHAYGRVRGRRFVNLPKTKLENGFIKWVEPESRRDPYFPPRHEIITPRQMVVDLKDYSKPLILDVDLDAFYSLDIDEPNDETIRSQDEKKLLAKQRMEGIMNVISQIPAPGLITIARSQNPYPFTPSEIVDFLQREIMMRLFKVYSNHKMPEAGYEPATSR